MGTYLHISYQRKCRFQLNALWRDRVCLKSPEKGLDLSKFHKKIEIQNLQYRKLAVKKITTKMWQFLIFPLLCDMYFVALKELTSFRRGHLNDFAWASLQHNKSVFAES